MLEEKHLGDNEVEEKLDHSTHTIDNEGDTLEFVLSHVGDMGLYQKLLFIAMMPFGFGLAWTYFVQIFITIAPQDHWCRIPELTNLSLELRKPTDTDDEPYKK